MNAHPQGESQKIKQKIFRYCAYRERCHTEVKTKLYELGLHRSQVDELLVELIEQDFLNEERFAKAYCRGKFLHNQWGRIKIMQGLRQRQISDYCIKQGMKEINEKSYLETLQQLSDRYSKKYSQLNAYERRQRTKRYLMQKGFEIPLIDEVWADEEA